MGKGKKNQQDFSGADLQPYLSDSEDEGSLEESVPMDELEKAEMAKALLLENLPITPSDKVSASHYNDENKLARINFLNSTRS